MRRAQGSGLKAQGAQGSRLKMNNSDRDRAIETLLRSRRGEERSAACVDAESLGAWIDGGLSADARAQVEHHATDCARCQALLASMARTTPAVEHRAWWRSTMAQWLVPAAAVATALVVWVAVDRDSYRSSTLQTPATERATSANAPAPAAVTGSREAVPPTTSPEPSSLPERKRAEDNPRKKQERVVGQAPTTAAIESAPGPPRPAAPVPLPLAAAPSPPAAPPPAADESKAAPQSVAETVTITDATASKLAAARAAGNGAGVEGTSGEIASPDPNYRWRIVPPASIQRSTDGGVTWSLVDPVPTLVNAGPVTTILSAGASPARDVCWIVGRNGIVLLSTDGATWRRLQIPEPLDLASVRAADASHAVVTAANGRRFATTDGGTTWTATR
jgi:photosynthesis system II assembly factor YCF48-like protein/putative zinc finger protein